MVYPEKLKERVFKEYPKNETLKKFMQEPNGYELRILSELVDRLEPKEVLRMIKKGQIEKLQKKVETIVRQEKLYDDCFKASCRNRGG